MIDMKIANSAKWGTFILIDYLYYDELKYLFFWFTCLVLP